MAFEDSGELLDAGVVLWAFVSTDCSDRYGGDGAHSWVGPGEDSGLDEGHGGSESKEDGGRIHNVVGEVFGKGVEVEEVNETVKMIVKLMENWKK